MKYRKDNDPRFVIQNWMRNRNTVEFLAVWEELHNPDFNRVQFEAVRSEAGLNRFVMTPTKWIEQTNAIGIVSKAGRYGGGTYAHSDIAMAFQIVLPNKMDTDIIVINASHKRVVLLDTWKVATSNMLNIIELIESWMISNEIWYIQPSVIEKIPEVRLKIICEDIRYWQGEHKLWEVYDMSIFDDLRQKYFKIYKDNDNLDDEYEEKERQKFIPQKRLNKEQREKNMRRLMGKLQYYGDFRDMTKE